MRTGRRPVKKDAAIFWLQDILERGPVLVEEIKARTPASWRTTDRAKKQLDVKSKKIDDKWYWFFESAPNLSQDEPEDRTCYTSGMVLAIKEWLRMHEDESNMVDWLIQDCRAYPTNPPYPESYIDRKSVV